MDQIVHKNLTVNGINMHMAELGQGPATVLFLHGFPELWYSWRHQMVDVSAKGYRAIAPDLRGYGGTDAPPESSSYTYLHIVGDLVALLDALGLEQVFLVGHDWGAIIAWWFCLLRPDRIKALVNTSVTFMPRDPNIKPIQGFRDAFGDAFHVCRFQEVGKVEEAFTSTDAATIMTSFLSLRDPNPVFIPVELGLEGFFKGTTLDQLPSWLTKEDIDYYAAQFTKPALLGDFTITAPWI